MNDNKIAEEDSETSKQLDNFTKELLTEILNNLEHLKPDFSNFFPLLTKGLQTYQKTQLITPPASPTGAVYGDEEADSEEDVAHRADPAAIPPRVALACSATAMEEAEDADVLDDLEKDFAELSANIQEGTAHAWQTVRTGAQDLASSCLGFFSQVRHRIAASASHAGYRNLEKPAVEHKEQGTQTEMVSRTPSR